MHETETLMVSSPHQAWSMLPLTLPLRLMIGKLGRQHPAPARFSNFTEENDPHGEHDFGNFQLVGRTFYWKIDLYNSEMDGGSGDPTDPEKTTRVLTLMLAEDY
jgi:hypothetical protein